MQYNISIVIKSLSTLLRNCGGMEHPSFKSAGTCKTGNKGIIYAWAYDAPGLTLPKGMFYCLRKNWQQFVFYQLSALCMLCSMQRLCFAKLVLLIICSINQCEPNEKKAIYLRYRHSNIYLFSEEKKTQLPALHPMNTV